MKVDFEISKATGITFTTVEKANQMRFCKCSILCRYRYNSNGVRISQWLQSYNPRIWIRFWYPLINSIRTYLPTIMPNPLQEANPEHNLNNVDFRNLSFCPNDSPVWDLHTPIFNHTNESSIFIEFHSHSVFQWIHILHTFANDFISALLDSLKKPVERLAWYRVANRRQWHR